jgi:DNA-binding transcriptional LysR family regulator
MELTQLRYFYEAARFEHITKAANALRIAQPAITLSIRRLEDELGVKLFKRCGRGVALTECGRHLYVKLEEVFKILDPLPEDLTHIANYEKDTVNINLLAASTIVTDIIIEYKRKNPEVTFRVSQQLGHGGSDITVYTEPGNVGAPSKNTFVMYENIYLGVPAGSDFASRESLRLDEVREEGFISLAGSKSLRAMCDNFCSTAGFTPRVIFESDNPYTVKNMIASGMGVGFWPSFSWGRIESGDVRLIPVSYPECSRSVIVEKTDNRSSETVDRFFEYLKKRLTELKTR